MALSALNRMLTEPEATTEQRDWANDLLRPALAGLEREFPSIKQDPWVISAATEVETDLYTLISRGGSQEQIDAWVARRYPRH
jgi:hypothetical protein